MSSSPRKTNSKPCESGHLNLATKRTSENSLDTFFFSDGQLPTTEFTPGEPGGRRMLPASSCLASVGLDHQAPRRSAGSTCPLRNAGPQPLAAAAPLQPLAKDRSGQSSRSRPDQLYASRAVGLTWLDTLTADLCHSAPTLLMYRCEISCYALSRASANSSQKSIVARPYDRRSAIVRYRSSPDIGR